MKKHDSTAIVVGAGIGGLVAARAMSDHFGTVVVLDKDPDVGTSAPRKGANQGHHVHLLLCAGLEVLEHYYPGIGPEMMERGVEAMDFAADFSWRHFGVDKLRFESDFITYPQSRGHLEATLHRRTKAEPNVEIRAGLGVDAIRLSEDGSHVVGVRTRDADGREGTLDCDLLVDASGRGSRFVGWLEELGFPRPVEETIGIDIAYASRFYERPSTPAGDWSSILVGHVPPDVKRGGLIVPIENDGWVVTLFGYLGDHPPTDDAGHLEFARSLAVPAIHDAMVAARPVSDIVRYRFKQMRRRRFEKLSRVPGGFVALGDAVCSLDPAFAQGMAVALMETRVLDECLAEWSPTDPAFAKRFYQRIRPIVDVPWALTSGESQRFPELAGGRPPHVTFLHWYMERIARLSGHRRDVHQRFLHVMHLLESPATLFHPRVLGAVLFGKGSSGPSRSEAVQGA